MRLYDAPYKNQPGTDDLPPLLRRGGVRLYDAPYKNQPDTDEESLHAFLDAFDWDYAAADPPQTPVASADESVLSTVVGTEPCLYEERPCECENRWRLCINTKELLLRNAHALVLLGAVVRGTNQSRRFV